MNYVITFQGKPLVEGEPMPKGLLEYIETLRKENDQLRAERTELELSSIKQQRRARCAR